MRSFLWELVERGLEKAGFEKPESVKLQHLKTPDFPKMIITSRLDFLARTAQVTRAQRRCLPRLPLTPYPPIETSLKEKQA